MARPSPVPPEPRRATRVHPVEALEEPGQVVALDAGPGVRDLHVDAVAGAGRRHGGPPALRRVLHRVVEQVHEHLLERAGVGQHRGALGDLARAARSSCGGPARRRPPPRAGPWPRPTPARAAPATAATRCARGRAGRSSGGPAARRCGRSSPRRCAPGPGRPARRRAASPRRRRWRRPACAARGWRWPRSRGGWTRRIRASVTSRSSTSTSPRSSGTRCATQVRGPSSISSRWACPRAPCGPPRASSAFRVISSTVSPTARHAGCQRRRGRSSRPGPCRPWPPGRRRRACAASSSRSGWTRSRRPQLLLALREQHGEPIDAGRSSARGPPPSSASRARMAACTGSRNTATAQAPSAGSSSR